MLDVSHSTHITIEIQDIHGNIRGVGRLRKAKARGEDGLDLLWVTLW